MDKWLPDATYTSLLGAPAKRSEAVNAGGQYIIVNYDVLEWLVKTHPSVVASVDAVILDESSKLKDHKTKRWKLLRKLKKKALSKAQWISLTGTPAAQGLLHLWAQAQFLENGRVLGDNFSAYRARYFIQQDYMGYKWECRDPNAIYARLEGQVSVLTPDSPGVSLDLPELVVETHPVVLSSGLLRDYSKFKKTMVLEEVTAVNAAVLSGKLRQFANGFLYLENGHTQNLHQEKLVALKELLAEIEGPVILVYEFQKDRDMLRELPGAVVLAEDDTAIDRWNDGKIDLLLLHPKSAGYGLNLQASGDTLIWFGPPWSLEDWHQTVGRIWRQGQRASTVFCHVLTAEDTIDERIMEVLNDKDVTQENLMNALQSEFKS